MMRDGRPFANFRSEGFFLLKEAWTHRCTLEVLKELERTQYLSPTELHGLQWERAQRLLNFAYESVPYYREAWKKTGIHPSDLKGFGDLAQLPILTKEKVRRETARLRAKGFFGHETIVRTSGSTGFRLEFPQDSVALSHHLANSIRGRSWWGIKVGDPEVKFWGVSLPFETTIKGRLISLARRVKDISLGVLHLSPFNLKRETLLRYYHLIRRVQPKLLFGYGVALYVLAKFMKDEELNFVGYRPQAVIYTSETLYPSQKALIEEVFGTRVICEYGSVECGIIAYECPSGNLHLSDETLYVEVLQNSQRGLGEGWGELIITHLTKFSFPFIRYNQGDIGALADQHCSCGRGLKVLKGLIGRANELIKKPNGEYIHPELFDYVMRAEPGIRRYRIIERTLGNLQVLVEPADGIKGLKIGGLQQRLFKFIGSEVSIEVSVVEEIPPDYSGKFRWVIPSQATD